MQPVWRTSRRNLTSHQQGEAEFDGCVLHIFTYNTCSLLADGRLDRLLEELEDQHWDVVVVQESHREARREILDLHCGHTWYGSGGCRGSCGVGFLVNRQLCKHKFGAVNERLATLDIFCEPVSIRILGVYMPDTSHSEAEVDLMYCQMDEHLHQGQLRKHACMVAGDMNAQCGSRMELDNECILGPFGAFSRTSRGQRLLRWCDIQGLRVANTFFQSETDSAWTYSRGETQRQLDYLLMDAKIFRSTHACYVSTAVHIGSDHRPLVAEVFWSNARCNQRIRKTQNTWHNDKQLY